MTQYVWYIETQKPAGGVFSELSAINVVAEDVSEAVVKAASLTSNPVVVVKRREIIDVLKPKARWTEDL